MKRAPLPIRTHSNIAATLNSGCNTGTRYFATPVEASVSAISIDGTPIPMKARSVARTEAQMDLTHIYKAKPGKHQFVKGSAREQVWSALKSARKGLTVAALKQQLPTIPGIRAALQVLISRKQAEEIGA
jgi:hypothetical protein